MLPKPVHIVLVLALTLIPSVLSVGAEPRVPLGSGGFFSPKGCGVSVFFHPTEGAWNEIQVRTDFHNVLNGKYFPGVMGGYFLLYPAASWKGADGFACAVTVGPGLSAGYARDHGKGHGLVAALSGRGGVTLSFATGFIIRLSLSADAGFHVDVSRPRDGAMTLYQNGLRRIYYPELNIIYRFR